MGTSGEDGRKNNGKIKMKHTHTHMVALRAGRGANNRNPTIFRENTLVSSSTPRVSTLGPFLPTTRASASTSTPTPTAGFYLAGCSLPTLGRFRESAEHDQHTPATPCSVRWSVRQHLPQALGTLSSLDQVLRSTAIVVSERVVCTPSQQKIGRGGRQCSARDAPVSAALHNA